MLAVMMHDTGRTPVRAPSWWAAFPPTTAPAWAGGHPAALFERGAHPKEAQKETQKEVQSSGST